MVIVTHESYDSVLVGTGKLKGLGVVVWKPRDGADATWRGRSFQTENGYAAMSHGFCLVFRPLQNR